MVALPVGSDPIGMGGSAAKAEPTGWASVGPRIGTACTPLTTGDTTGDGPTSTGVPGLPWTVAVQLPMTTGAVAPLAAADPIEPATTPPEVSRPASAVAAPIRAQLERIPSSLRGHTGR